MSGKRKMISMEAYLILADLSKELLKERDELKGLVNSLDSKLKKMVNEINRVQAIEQLKRVGMGLEDDEDY